jgi:hypothetical protein
MGLLRHTFIERSTLGLLKGEDGGKLEAFFAKKGKPFNELSIWGKTQGFFLVSFIRFLGDLITLLLPIALFTGIVKATIFHFSYSGEPLVAEASAEMTERFGFGLNWWSVFMIESIGMLILCVVFYVFLRNIVNAVSIIYYALK